MPPEKKILPSAACKQNMAKFGFQRYACEQSHVHTDMFITILCSPISEAKYRDILFNMYVLRQELHFPEESNAKTPFQGAKSTKFM